MRRSIRKFVGVAAGGLGLSVAVALVVTPMLASASPNAREIDARSVGAAGFAHETSGIKDASAALMLATQFEPAGTNSAAPSASCTAAKNALVAARAQNAAEDAQEMAAGTAGTPADIAEDKAEWAALKPMIDAVISACGFTRPAPSAACTSAMTALKNAIAADRAEDASEAAAGTEGTPADVAEDQAERAALAPLFVAVKNACGFTTFFHR